MNQLSSSPPAAAAAVATISNGPYKATLSVELVAGDATDGNTPLPATMRVVVEATAAPPADDSLKLRLRLPAALVALGNTRVPFKDNQQTDWTLSITRPIKPAGIVDMTLSPTGNAVKPVANSTWNLAFTFGLSLPRNASTTVQNVKMALFAKALTPVDPLAVQKAEEVPQSKAVVRLISDPSFTNTLSFGEKVILTWELSGIVEHTARLYGSMFEGRERAVEPEGFQIIYVMGPATYLLTAQVTRNGVTCTEVSSISVDVVHTGAARLTTFPRANVLPGGPFAAYWAAVNVTSMTFHLSRSPGGNEGLPHISPVPNRRNGSWTRTDESFTVPAGPGQEKETWQLLGIIGNGRTGGLPPAPVSSLPVSADWPRYVGKDIFHGAVAMAAGHYDGKDGDHDVVVNWATAANPKGLDVIFVWRVSGKTDLTVKMRHPVTGVNCLGVVRTSPIDEPTKEDIAAASSPGNKEDVKPVNGREDAKKRIRQREQAASVVMAAKKDEKVSLQLLEKLDTLVPDEHQPPSSKHLIDLPDGFAADDRLCLLALGTRVYVLGRRRAISVDIATGIRQYVEEPWLARLPWPDWEVVAVPGLAAGQGAVYALDKRSGTLLRLDKLGTFTATGGTLTAPRRAASVNGRLAGLDALQRAQLGAGDFLADDGSFKFKGGKREEIADPVDTLGSMLAVAGALVVRGQHVNPNVKVVQGRAYDPARDAWVRCGQMFPNVKVPEGGLRPLLASTRDAPPCDLGSPGPADGAVFCLHQGELHYFESDEMLELIGFLGHDLAPNKALAGPVTDYWPDDLPGRVCLRPGERLKPGCHLQSFDGRYRLFYTEKGFLELHKMTVSGNKGEKLSALDDVPRSAHYAIIKDGMLSLRRNDNDNVEWDSHSKGQVWGLAAFQAAAARQKITLKDGFGDADLKSELAGSRLVVEDDGRVILYSAGGVRLWQMPRHRTELKGGEYMVAGDTVGASRDVVCLEYTLNGALKTNQLKTNQWSTGATGAPGEVVLKPDGLLELYRAEDPRPFWSTAVRGGLKTQKKDTAVKLTVTQGVAKIDAHLGLSDLSLWSSRGCRGNRSKELAPGQYLESEQRNFALVMQWDGNLVLYRRGEQTAVWQSLSAPPRTDGSGDDKGMTLRDDGELWAGKWKASPANGGVGGKPFQGHAGEVLVDEQGFSVLSQGGAAWYTVSEDNGRWPDPGKVYRRNVWTCKIYHSGLKGYLYAHSEARENGDRMVYVKASGGGNLKDITWLAMLVTPGRYALYNIQHGTWLYVSQYRYNERGGFFKTISHNRRLVFHASDGVVFKHKNEECGFFAISPGPWPEHTATIQSVRDGEYVYGADFAAEGDDRRVFTWVPKEHVSNGYWRFEKAE